MLTQELNAYGFGRERTLQQFEAFSGVDFKRKIASEKALRCLFIKDLQQNTATVRFGFLRSTIEKKP